MRVLVCMKQVPDPARTQYGANDTLNRNGADQITNPADASALEFAYLLKNTCGCQAEIWALSMGTKRAANMLRQAASLGADHLVLISDPKFAGSDSYATAAILSAAIRHLGSFDLVLCGRRSIDGETGQVGPELSVFLDFPCLTNVVSVDHISETEIQATAMTEIALQSVRLSLPAILTVCESHAKSHVPSIRELRAAAGAKLTILSNYELALPINTIGSTGSRTRVIRTHIQDTCLRGVIPERDVPSGIMQIAKWILEVEQS